MNKQYKTPAVLGVHPVEMEASIMQSSIVEFIGNVESTGQQVHGFEWDNNQNTFNHNWDE